MRKFMSVLVLMLPMFLSLSCSDDDSPNEYESQFVGQWVILSMKSIILSLGVMEPGTSGLSSMAR